MESSLALTLVLGLLVVATTLGVVLRRTQTRVTVQVPSEAAQLLTPEQLLPDQLTSGNPASGRQSSGAFAFGGVKAPDFGERATLVQFSTETCARCPATARVLASEASAVQGVAHIEVDVTHRDELIKRFNVLRTPTVLLLDASGQVRSRVSGPMTTSQTRELLATL